MSTSNKRARPSSPDAALASSNEDAPPDAALTIFRSQEIEDRFSKFVAFFNPSTKIAPRELQRHEEFTSASHRILAWRRPSKQKSLRPGAPPLMETGYDEDGEEYAGKRVVRVLDEEKVEGSLVVARWYGGVLLGPVRFTWIEQVARAAIRAWRDGNVGSNVKRAKVETEDEQDGRDRAELEQTLRDRDESIAVLRDLLSEKSGQKGSQGQDEVVNGKKQGPDYSKMPEKVLRKLEKARDATIGFILKEIDRAEKDDGVKTSEHEQPETVNEGSSAG